jgi:hypothetical protein
VQVHSRIFRVSIRPSHYTWDMLEYVLNCGSTKRNSTLAVLLMATSLMLVSAQTAFATNDAVPDFTSSADCRAPDSWYSGACQHPELVAGPTGA